jgi:hypothetical protein
MSQQRSDPDHDFEGRYVVCRAYRQSSSGNSVCRRNATIRATGRRPPKCRGIEIEQGRDEFPAIDQRGHFDQAHLKCHRRIRQRPCFAPQSIDKGRQVAVVQRASDPFHDETPPQLGLGNVDEVGRVGDECRTNAERAGPRSTWLPDSASSVMERSSSSNAMASCWKRQEWMNASLTLTEAGPLAFSRRAERTASRSPSAAKNLSVRGSRPLRKCPDSG